LADGVLAAEHGGERFDDERDVFGRVDFVLDVLRGMHQRQAGRADIAGMFRNVAGDDVRPDNSAEREFLEQPEAGEEIAGDGVPAFAVF